MIVIHTPRLCGEPIFVGAQGGTDDAASEAKRKAVSVIECRPVVKDEALLDANAALFPSVDAKAASDPFAEPAIEGSQSLLLDNLNEQTGAQPPLPSHDEATSAAGAEHGRAGATALHQSESSDQSKDAANDFSLGDFDLESYVMVIDPATGEIIIEADGDAQAAASAGLATGGEAMDKLTQLLQQSIQNVFKEMAQDADLTNAIANGNGQNTGSEPKADSQLADQQRDNPQSRMKQAGPHHHAKIAEQFLKGQLGKGNFAGKGDRTQPIKAAHHRAAGVKELGTAQHQDLKKAFQQKMTTKQEEEGSSEQTKAAIKDEL